MKIARFGDTWATAYEFASLGANDDWSSERSALLQEVGGASGAFDFFGADNYPIEPMVIKKEFVLLADSFAGLESDLIDLRASTIVEGRSKIWGYTRDGNQRWAWAKCVALEIAEHPKEYIHKAVKLEFVAPEGVWYADTETKSYTIPVGTNYTGAISSIFDDNFNLTTPAKVTITNSGVSTDWLKIDNSTQSIEVEYNGTLADGKTLILDAATYSITNDGSDDYANLDVPAGQIIWVGLNTVQNNQLGVRRDNTGGTTDVTWEWTPMSLM